MFISRERLQLMRKAISDNANDIYGIKRLNTYSLGLDKTINDPRNCLLSDCYTNTTLEQVLKRIIRKLNALEQYLNIEEVTEPAKPEIKSYRRKAKWVKK